MDVSGWGRRVVVVVLVAALLAASVVAVAVAASDSGSTDPGFAFIPVRNTGSLIVTFTGAPGAGCARLGVCGIHGTVTLKPSSRDRLPVILSSNVLLSVLGGGGDGSVTARVVEADGGTCRDQSLLDTDPYITGKVDQFALVVAVAGGEVFSTRCGGPTASDVLAKLPRASLSRAQLLAGHGSVPLRGGGAFSADGFTGTVRSTIVTTLGPPSYGFGPKFPTGATGASGTTGATGASGATGTTGATERVVIQKLQLLATTGAFSGTFTPQPGICETLDACSDHGSVAWQLQPQQIEATLQVQGPASVPAAAMEAVLHGAKRPAGVSLGAFFFWQSGGSARVSIRLPKATCATTRPLSYGAFQLFASDQGFEDFEQQLGPERCPGPVIDLKAIPSLLGSGLSGNALVVALQHPTASDQAFAFKLGGVIRLRFARGAIKQFVQPPDSFS